MSCEEFQEIAGEVARQESRAAGKDIAGLTAATDPRERAGALAHIEKCGRCRQEFVAQKELSERLRSMADEMNAFHPPSSLEAKVLAAFRDRNRVSAIHPARQSFGSRRRYWALAAAAGLLFVLGMFVWQISSSRPRVQPLAATNETARGSVSDQIPSPSNAVSGTSTIIQASKGAAPKRPRPRRHQAPAQTATAAAAKQSATDPEVISTKAEVKEIATDFVPVGYGSALDLRDGGQLVRVELPRSALTRFGLPMNMNRADERVKADVLVGPDGLPRAIRFVLAID
jgi:hypothetical protein